MNIQFRTQRQFDAVLRKEGKTILDYITGDQYRVFFRTMKHSDNTSSKLRLFYPKEANISRGTIFTLYNEQYLVVNKDSIESEIYSTSVAVRCTQKFLCGGINIPFVVSDLKNVYPTSGGSIMSIVGGSITVYTGDNSLFRSVDIDDTYVAFGGTYKVINTFYNDGLGYLYLSREVSSVVHTLTYAGATELIFEDGTYQLAFEARSGDAIVSNPNLTYKSSDDSVATVSETGLLTMVSDGTVEITATWADYDITCTANLTIIKKEEKIPLSCSISGSTSIKLELNRTMTAVVLWNETDDVTDAATIKWSVSNFSSNVKESDINMSPNGTKCSFRCYNESALDGTFTLTLEAGYGGYTATASVTMTITGLF